MATITEDYVSFETAKLLKEKGFDEKCEHAYFNGGFFNKEEYGLVLGDNFTVGDLVFAPTLQMAMKWLREVHKLSVEVYRTACGYIGCVVAIPSGTDKKFLEKDGDDLPSGQYITWEKACEAAIKYCLENLI